MITRWTTPTIRFVFTDVDLEQIDHTELTVWQGETIIATRDETDADCEGGYITGESGPCYVQWTLTQEETGRLRPKVRVKSQCRYTTLDDHAYASKEQEDIVRDVKRGGVIPRANTGLQ